MKHLETHTDDANPITEAHTQVTQLSNLEVHGHRRLSWHDTRMMMMIIINFIIIILRIGYTNRLNVLAARECSRCTGNDQMCQLLSLLTVCWT